MYIELAIDLNQIHNLYFCKRGSIILLVAPNNAKPREIILTSKYRMLMGRDRCK